MSGKQADDTSNEVPLADYPTKALMIQALERSSREAVAAFTPDLKRIELMMAFIEHTGEHYGQLAVYSRLAGIVPPASR